MHRARHILPLATLFAAAACTGSTDDVGVPEVLEVVGEPSPAGEAPRGIYMVQSPEEAIAPGANELMLAGETIIYMNKTGGTFTPGSNDARVNRSSVPTQTSTIPAWNVSDAGWQQVMTCVQDQFARFNVTITDVDPGNVPHFESVVAGSPGQLGLPNGVGGVSPFTSNCSTIPNSIVYTFAEVYGTDYQAICHTVAQEVAHSFGLDHEYLCADPMTYLGGCGAKAFQDTDAQCGEFEVRQCYCSATQNSVQMLYQRVGPKDVGVPNVNIARPADGATVAPGFVVEAQVDTSLTIDRVELYIDGSLVTSSDIPPFVFNAPADLGDGTHIVETKAFDDQGNEGTASVSVNVSANANPEDPADPSDPSDPSDPANPSGPASGNFVGGCAVASSGAGAQGLGLMLLGLAFALRRRRR